MARVVRHLRPMQLLERSLHAVPGLLRSVRWFRNWAHLARLYAGLADFCPPVDAIGRRGFRLRLWEPADVQTLWVVFCADSYRVLKRAPTPVVLDIGANVGAFTLLAATALGAKRIIAVEPVAATFEHLAANVQLNGLQALVTSLRLGIAGRSGTRIIHLGRSTAHSSLYYRGDPCYERGHQEQINVTTLDDLFHQLDLTEVDLCKMDCEGAEHEALRVATDGTLRRMKRICMEYHPEGEQPDRERLFGRLREAGFRCTMHDARDRLAVFDRTRQ